MCARFLKWGGSACVVVLVAAATLLPGAAARAAEPAARFTDPFAYCAAVGDVDAPDARWAGPKLPEAVTKGEISLGLVNEHAPEEFLTHAVWRCMGGKVYLCSFGANLPCEEKADTSKTPSPAMGEFCRTTPDSDFIPAYVSGRATIYDWSCKDGVPQPGRELVKPDARGFLSNIWYELPASPR
jgi:hypothetical protein